MNDSKYLIELVIKARNEVSKQIQEIRGDLTGLESDLKKVDKTTSQSINKSATSSKTAVKQATEETAGLVKETDKLIDKKNNLVKIEKQIEQQYSRSANRANANGVATEKATNNYIAGLKSLSKEWDNLSKKAPIGSTFANSFREQSEMVKHLSEQVEEHAQTVANAETKKRNAMLSTEALGHEIGDAREKAERERSARNLAQIRKDSQSEIDERRKSWESQLVIQDATDVAFAASQKRSSKRAIDKAKKDADEANKITEEIYKERLTLQENTDNAFAAASSRSSKQRKEQATKDAKEENKALEESYNERLQMGKDYNDMEKAQEKRRVKQAEENASLINAILNEKAKEAQKKLDQDLSEKEKLERDSEQRRLDSISDMEHDRRVQSDLSRANELKNMKEYFTEVFNLQGEAEDKQNNIKNSFASQKYFSNLDNEMTKGVRAAGLKRSETELRSSAKKVDLNSKDGINDFTNLTKAADAARDLRIELEGTAKSSDKVNLGFIKAFKSADGFTNKLKALQRESEKSKLKVSQLDNSIRGLVVAGALIFVEQLATGLIALGGALVSVGTSAVGAAGAIGGALTSALLQAAPIAAGLGSALYRLQNVFEALKQSRTVQEQSYANSAKDANKESNAIDGVANANDALVGAQDRLADSRDKLRDAEDKLREARAGARDELRELINAEKDAELAARGAALSQEEAQNNLRKAILSGDTIAQQRAQIDLESAGVNVSSTAIDARRATKAANKGRSGELPDVKAAQDQLRAAQKEMAAAAIAGVKAQQGVEKAARSSKIAADNITAAQGKLDYLLNNQLTASEVNLYKALDRLWDKADEATSRLAQPIIEAFTFVADDAQRILGNKKLFDAFLSTSTVTAETIKTVWSGIFTEKTFADLEFFSGEANRNLPILGDSFVKLFDSLLNIGRAFSPIFSDLVDDVFNLSSELQEATSNTTKMDKLAVRFGDSLDSLKDLLSAVGTLITATFRSSALEEGNSLVGSFADSIRDLAKYMNDNGEATNNFFRDSANSTRELGRLVVVIVKAMAQIFDPESMKVFIDFLEQALIPAFVTSIDVVGRITKGIASLNKLFGGALFDIAQYAIALALISTTIKSLGVISLATLTPIGKLTKAYGLVMTALSGSGSILEKARKGWVALAGAMGLASKASAGGLVPNVPYGPGGAGKTPDVKKGGLAKYGGLAGGLASAGVVYGGYKALESIGRDRNIQTDNAAADLANLSAKYRTPGEAKKDLESRRASSLTDLRIKDYGAGLLGKGANDVGNLQREGGKFQTFTKRAVADFEKLRKAKNATGLDSLAKETRDMAKEYPVAGKQLNAFADEIGRQRDLAKDAAKELLNMKKKAKELAATAREEKARGGNSDFNQSVYQNSLSQLSNATGSGSDITKQLNTTLANVDGAYKKGSIGNIDEKAKSFEAAMTSIRTNIANGNITQKEGFEAMAHIVDKQTTAIGNSIKKGSKEGKDAYAHNLRLMRLETQDAGDAQVKIADRTRQRLNRVYRNTAKDLGLEGDLKTSTQDRPEVEAAGNKSKQNFNFRAVGGRVGLKGERGADNIAMIGRGEAILNHDQQRYVDTALKSTYGYDLDGLFKGTNSVHGAGPGFATGGRTGGLQPGIKRLSDKVIDKFPGLVVTSTTGGTHAKNSNHYKGLAADISGSVEEMKKAAAWVKRNAGSSLLEGIFNPSLSIKGGKSVPSSFWGATTWAGHANHLHLALAGAGDNLTGLAGGDEGGSGSFNRGKYDKKIASILKGMKTNGLMAKGLKKALQKLAKKSADKLEASSGNGYSDSTSYDDAGGLDSAGGSFDKSELKKLWKRAGGPSSVANIAAAIALAESNGNPNARNSIGATGLWQIYNGPGTSLSLKDPWENAKAAVAKYKGSNNTFNPWTTYTGLDTGPGGGPGPKTYLRYLASGGFAPGGSRTPEWGGWHANGLENKVYNRPTLLGVGENGPESVSVTPMGKMGNVFAGANSPLLKVLTILTYSNKELISSLKRTNLAFDRSKKLGLDPLVMSETPGVAIKVAKDTLGTAENVKLGDSKKNRKILKDLLSDKSQKLIDKYYSKIAKEMNRVVGDEGLIVEIRDRFEKSRTRRIVKNALNKRFSKNSEGSVKDTYADPDNGALNSANDSVKQSAQEYEDILKTKALAEKGFVDADKNFKKAVNDLAKLVKARQKISKKNSAKRKRINTAIANQRKRVNTSRTTLVSAQDRVDEENQSLADNLEAQAQAQADKQQAIYDQEAKRISNINAYYSVANSVAETQNKFGTATGNNSSIANVITSRITNASNQINDLMTAWSSTTDVSVKQDIEQQIRDLQNTIVDGTIDLFNNATDAVKKQIADTKFGTDFVNGLIDSSGAVGLGGVNATAANNLKGGNLLGGQGRLSIAQTELRNLQDDEVKYYGLWQKSMEFGIGSEQERQAKQDYYNNLTEQNAKNRNIREMKIADVIDRGSKAVNILDKDMQIATNAALINGTDPNAAKSGFLAQRGSALSATAVELQGLLAAAVAVGDDDEIERLKSSIQDNTLAQQDNTLQIKAATGSENAQSFSTTGWERFRAAIFNGNNGLIGDYANLVPAMDTGGTIIKNGYAYLHQGEQVVPAKITREVSQGFSSRTVTQNITVNEAGRRDDTHLYNRLLKDVNTPNDH